MLTGHGQMGSRYRLNAELQVDIRWQGVLSSEHLRHDLGSGLTCGSF